MVSLKIVTSLLLMEETGESRENLRDLTSKLKSGSCKLLRISPFALQFEPTTIGLNVE